MDDYGFVAGDLSKETLERIYQMIYMREMLSEANVFRYDPELDSVVYHDNFGHVNEGLIGPESSGKLDSDRLQRSTTWKPGKGVDISWVTDIAPLDEIPDRIDLLFEVGQWFYPHQQHIYIGIYNSRPDEGPVQVSVKMRDFEQDSLLSTEMLQRKEIFEKIYKGTDAFETSCEERSDKEEYRESSFTYGEALLNYYVPLLNYAKPQPGEIFLDIGCGACRPQILAALTYPELKVCKGIEYLGSLV